MDKSMMAEPCRTTDTGSDDNNIMAIACLKSVP